MDDTKLEISEAGPVELIVIRKAMVGQQMGIHNGEKRIHVCVENEEDGT